MFVLAAPSLGGQPVLSSVQSDDLFWAACGELFKCEER